VRDGRSPDAAIIGTSVLQRLHTLLQALNPHKRQIFLRTHNLVPELQGAEEEEPHSENKVVPEEVDKGELLILPKSPWEEDVQLKQR
jgi:hypothetical protein